MHTADRLETAAVVDRLEKELPARISDARVRTQMLETSPPIGIPVQVRIFGADVEALRDLAAQVKDGCVRSPAPSTSTTTGTSSDEMRHKGEPLRRAVADAGLARLRPVVVTVLACVGGLIPLAISGGPLWEPMCYVQIMGMLVATLVTLVLVPVLYVVFVEDLHLVRWEVEPGHEPTPSSI